MEMPIKQIETEFQSQHRVQPRQKPDLITKMRSYKVEFVIKVIYNSNIYYAY